MFGANDTRNTAVVAFGEKEYQQDITMQKVTYFSLPNYFCFLGLKDERKCLKTTNVI